ncbi:hypothetical protein CC2G_006278 [Coprinopsis cinerea AmutBmut pab1-1]|nr:hypothetical protein CC2G_006278 [Coprinopsis cinerea AmutBmut pab1-1]
MRIHHLFLTLLAYGGSVLTLPIIARDTSDIFPRNTKQDMIMRMKFRNMAYAKSLIRRELLSFLLEARSFDEELAAAIAAQTEAKPKRRFTQLKIRHGHGQGQAPDKGSPASRYSSVTMSKLAKSTAVQLLKSKQRGEKPESSVE